MKAAGDKSRVRNKIWPPSKETEFSNSDKIKCTPSFHSEYNSKKKYVQMLPGLTLNIDVPSLGYCLIKESLKSSLGEIFFSEL